MPICESCGQTNRSGARFCFRCANPLTTERTNLDDRQWLAASLADPLERPGPAATGATGPLVAPEPDPNEELPMDQANPRLFAGRYELPADMLGPSLTVVDVAPWHRCWACGSTANEAGDAFCNDCGASLAPRSYRASLTSQHEPIGAALISLIDDEQARAVLPDLIERIEADDQILCLLGDSGRGPLVTPLDETAALAVGATLARLMNQLHQRAMALGVVEPGDLEALPNGARLRDVPGLRQIPDDEHEAAIQSDLAALAELLEQLTATPRTTRRLSEDEATTIMEDDDPGLAAVLRQVRTGTITTTEALHDVLEHILAERTNPLALRQIVGAHSDVGIVRDHNEDSYLTLQLGLDNDGKRYGWGLYIVSDGMGGHAAGELASGLAIRAAADLIVTEYLNRAMQPDPIYHEASIKDLVRRAVIAANEAILSEARAQGNDMGATMTLAVVVGDRAIFGNVGDSRGYLLRDGSLRRVTKDHSLVQRLVDLGQIGADDVYTHPQRNAVLRSLGDRSQVEVDVFSERLRPGDAIFLCSDGQWEMTRDPEMERMLNRPDEANLVCDMLISAANQAGGEDNITAVLVRMG
ncbi:MAG: protein phosphatase 2C domain-containing protein [Oscillochloridaceae bacterium umkhey_bin13]